MQFDLTDEQKLLRDATATMFERAGKRQGSVERADAADYAAASLWDEIRDLGLTALLVPEGRGGLGGELLTLATVADEMGYAGMGSLALQQALGAWVLGACTMPPPEFERIVANDLRVSFALLDEGDGWRPDQWTLKGDSLTGQKRNVIGATQADSFLVGLAGGQLSLVDARAKGVAIRPEASVDGTRPTATVVFESASHMLLNIPSGLADRLYDALLIVDAADAFGAARRARDMTVDYVKVREQFGRPLGAFQAIKHQLATMSLDIEPCRAMLWYAAHCWDREMADTSRTAAIANAHLTEIGVKAGRTATEAHGGMGFTWEYPLHVFLKRAIFDRAHLGTPTQQRARAAELGGW